MTIPRPTFAARLAVLRTITNTELRERYYRYVAERSPEEAQALRQAVEEAG